MLSDDVGCRTTEPELTRSDEGDRSPNSQISGFEFRCAASYVRCRTQKVRLEDPLIMAILGKPARRAWDVQPVPCQEAKKNRESEFAIKPKLREKRR